MTFAVRCLPSVVMTPRTPALDLLLSVLQQGAELLKRDLTVTCGREGHGPDDPHSKVQALDVRSRDLAEGQIVALYEFLRKTLGPKWTVLYEVPAKPKGFLAGIAYVNPKASAQHFHIQPVKGTSWPT